MSRALDSFFLSLLLASGILLLGLSVSDWPVESATARVDSVSVIVQEPVD